MRGLAFDKEMVSCDKEWPLVEALGIGLEGGATTKDCSEDSVEKRRLHCEARHAIVKAIKGDSRECRKGKDWSFDGEKCPSQRKFKFYSK